MSDGKPVIVSKAVLEGLVWIEQSGMDNMYAYLEVVQLCFRKGFDHTAAWIINNRKLYEQGLLRGFEVEKD